MQQIILGWTRGSRFGFQLSNVDAFRAIVTSVDAFVCFVKFYERGGVGDHTCVTPVLGPSPKGAKDKKNSDMKLRNDV